MHSDALQKNLQQHIAVFLDQHFDVDIIPIDGELLLSNALLAWQSIEHILLAQTSKPRFDLLHPTLRGPVHQLYLEKLNEWDTLLQSLRAKLAQYPVAPSTLTTPFTASSVALLKRLIAMGDPQIDDWIQMCRMARQDYVTELGTTLQNPLSVNQPIHLTESNRGQSNLPVHPSLLHLLQEYDSTFQSPSLSSAQADIVQSPSAKSAVRQQPTGQQWQSPSPVPAYDDMNLGYVGQYQGLSSDLAPPPLHSFPFSVPLDNRTSVPISPSAPAVRKRLQFQMSDRQQSSQPAKYSRTTQGTKQQSSPVSSSFQFSQAEQSRFERYNLDPSVQHMLAQQHDYMPTVFCPACKYTGHRYPSFHMCPARSSATSHDIKQQTRCLRFRLKRSAIL